MVTKDGQRNASSTELRNMKKAEEMKKLQKKQNWLSWIRNM